MEMQWLGETLNLLIVWFKYFCTWWIRQLQPVSHATCLLSAFEILVSRCFLFYDRFVIQSRIKQKNVKLKTFKFLHILKYGVGYREFLIPKLARKLTCQLAVEEPSLPLTLNLPSLARQCCLSSWGPQRTPWVFCNFWTVWCGRLLKLYFVAFLKL